MQIGTDTQTVSELLNWLGSPENTKYEWWDENVYPIIRKYEGSGIEQPCVYPFIDRLNQAQLNKFYSELLKCKKKHANRSNS